MKPKMQGKHLFEYAVIRVVPRVEREEFLNVGVILYCRDQKFLKSMCELDEKRLAAFAKDIDIDEIKESLKAFGQISAGTREGGPIGKLDPASRFRWLTATRSTVVQTSKVHPGFCEEAQATLERVFGEQVLF
ncbi:MAG: DUF3037 domain-containing protein [Daejeonella sp.]|uniref:DUF3037 domain-containing protein n=1 Tax=Daejeonella sp. TaxID=2805397 RepID=UPI003C7697BD